MAKILVVSDIHGNYDALKEVLKEDFDFLIFSGDSVDYGPEPEKVVDELMNICYKGVMGNHDSANAFSIDCKCSEKYHDLSVKTREYLKGNLTKRHINFLGLLPLFNNFEIDGLRFTLVHGSLIDFLYDYVTPEMDDDEIVEKFKRSESDYVIFGHTHLPMVRKIGKTIYLNPGSVGQPRDGDPRASFAVIDTSKNSVEILRKEYPVEDTISKIMSLGLDENSKSQLVNILKSGGLF
ncbi:MAG: metallophosphoesterase family protein [Thermoplasmata archaeon]